MSSGTSSANARPSGLKAPTLVSSSTTTTTSTTSRLVRPTKMTASATSLSNSSGPAVLTEDTDDFIVGDRVWVGGTKAGAIQYIGDTQFAPGVWAGVVLDEPIGKNNGSVAGVQYFQCEPKRGVFSRLTKLTREPVESLVRAEQQRALEDTPKAANGSVRSASPRSQTRSSTPSGDWTPNLVVGDRVQVTSAVGIKNGTLRYVGTTNFAPGEWAGIELDNATGKNDGAVEGTRYFNCPMKYGLFAPVHKVSKSGTANRRGMATPLAAASSATTPRRIVATPGPKRIGSHESISTIGSARTSTSGTGNRGPRLGINSLTGTATKPSRSSAASITATQTAMQEALKEKEQHIEQLMKERDMERAEVVRAAALVDEAERELATARTSFRKQADEAELAATKLRESVAEAEAKAVQLRLQVDEEKKKVEDLQFRFEEEAIGRSDLESGRELDATRIRELDNLLNAERARADMLERQNNLNFQGEEELLTKHLNEIEDYKTKVKLAEDLVKSLEASKMSEDFRASQATEELVTRNESRIAELESIVQSLRTSEADAAKTCALLEATIVERDRTIAAREATVSGKNLGVAEAGYESESNAKVRQFEIDMERMAKRTEELQMENSDMRRSLQATQERLESAVEQKEKLATEIIEQMKSSGDNSAQLVVIKEELQAKDKEMDGLRHREQTLRQQCERLEEAGEQLKTQHQREVESLGTKHWEEVAKLEEAFHTARLDADRLRASCDQLDAERSKTTEDVRAQLAEWKLRVDEQMKRTSQLEDAVRAGDKARKAADELGSSLERKIDDIKADRDAANAEKLELVTARTRLELEKAELESRLARHEAERGDHAKAVGERDARLALLNSEVDRLKAEFEKHRIELQRQLAETTIDQDAVLDMRSHIEMQQKSLAECQESLRQAEADKLRLHEAVARAETLGAKNPQLEAKILGFQKQLEDSQRSHEAEEAALRKMLQTAQTLLQQREREIAVVREQKSVESGCALIETQRLRNELAQLESQLAEERKSRPQSASPKLVDGNSSMPDVGSDKLIEDKDALEGQIEFLNSVIVDMQRKNDELLSRIKVLEMGDLIKASSDINLNAVKASVVVPPRLFCDICDTFDLHDTEDCPKQETLSSDGPPPTQYHAARHQERPYCDICEVFGHWTNECDDNETF